MRKGLKILGVIGALLLLYGGLAWYQRTRPVTIEELLDPKTRLRAFHRLWLREDHHEMYDPVRGWGNFYDYHESIDILKCPQGEAEPLYLITRKTGALHEIAARKSPFDSLTSFKDSAVWKEWWGRFGSSHTVAARPELSPELRKWDRVVLNAVDHTGQTVKRPFNGNNVSEGYFYDLDGDGFLERADVTAYGGFDKIPNRRMIQPEVLEITRVKRTKEPVFSLIINLYLDENWDYICRDLDGDGPVEIQIGPQSAGGSIVPSVTFVWDQTGRTFVDRDRPDPTLTPYRILEGENPWVKVKLLNASGELAEHWSRNRK